MRRVKKTTNEQFDLLKAEMEVHPAAARGYGVGAQRSIVDAEWKDIVEKLNALGPPERTMTEWKKVWSDLRLRSIKRFSDEFTPKPKKVKYKSKKNKLLETLSSSDSIYVSYGNNIEQKSCLSPSNSHGEFHNDVDESYDNPLKEDDDLHNTNCYDVQSLKEEENIYHSYNSECLSPQDTIQTQFSQEKLNYLCQTLSSIEHQMQNQNKIMEHLTKFTSNLADLMERHVTSVEKQNNIMERQLQATECHNMFLRRQKANRKLRSKSKACNEVEKS